MNFWLFATQPRTWSLADVTWQQAVIALASVIVGVALYAAGYAAWLLIRTRRDIARVAATEAAVAEARREHSFNRVREVAK